MRDDAEKDDDCAFDREPQAWILVWFDAGFRHDQLGFPQSVRVVLADTMDLAGSDHLLGFRRMKLFLTQAFEYPQSFLEFRKSPP